MILRAGREDRGRIENFRVTCQGSCIRQDPDTDFGAPVTGRESFPVGRDPGVPDTNPATLHLVRFGERQCPLRGGVLDPVVGTPLHEICMHHSDRNRTHDLGGVPGPELAKLSPAAICATSPQ